MSADTPEHRRFSHGTTLWMGVIVGIVVTLGTFGASGGGVLSHTVCATAGERLPPFLAWIPAILANAPYGGIVWANGTVPEGPFLDSPEAPFLYGMAPINGTAVWAGFGGEFNVAPQKNQSFLGPGSNSPCQSPFDIAATFWGSLAASVPLLGAGNTSDVNEPSTLGMYILSSTAELGISNGFSGANQDPVSTCGSGATSRWVGSTGFSVSVPVSSGGSLSEQPYRLPFIGTFHYWFPANFGTWQIDNLSAPGGPGGGWAFSYSPCA